MLFLGLIGGERFSTGQPLLLFIMTQADFWPMTEKDLPEESAISSSFFMEKEYVPMFTGDDVEKINQWVEELL